MVYIFYNKLLLRVLVLLTGIGVGLATWHYVALSALKLPEQGARDALAIISFLAAGWLVMVIAEVIDNHYARAFGALCVLLGAWISYPWIFTIDGPRLLELTGAAGPFRQLTYGFWAAVAIAALLLILLVTRLIIDRVTLGLAQLPLAAQRADAVVGTAPPDAGRPAKPAELPPIPLDATPLQAEAAAAEPNMLAETVPPAVHRDVGPVSRLTAIGGLHLGRAYELTPGTHRVGRQDAELTLEGDNQVSRAHCTITVDAAQLVTVLDIGSTNGTFLNNQRITEAQLAPDDVLRIGTTLFKAEA